MHIYIQTYTDTLYKYVYVIYMNKYMQIDL